MNLGIQNHNFLITGASRGIGRAIAVSLLSEGANVGLVARGQVQLEQTVDELRQQYGEERVVGWPTDCADEFTLLELRQQITRLWERQTVLLLMSETVEVFRMRSLMQNNGRKYSR